MPAFQTTSIVIKDNLLGTNKGIPTLCNYLFTESQNADPKGTFNAFQFDPHVGELGARQVHCLI